MKISILFELALYTADKIAILILLSLTNIFISKENLIILVTDEF